VGRITLLAWNYIVKHYKIFEDCAGRREAVKQGWSWPACCFSFIWAFWKRMYGVGAVLFGVAVLLAFLSSRVDELFSLGDKTARSMDHLCQLGEWIIMTVLGVNGNEWREKNLVARGYVLRGALAAESIGEALAQQPKP
jgi:hypothetical protein